MITSTFLIIVLLVFILVIFIVLMIDYLPQLNTWQSRIHIGRYQTKDEWNTKVIEKSLKWLHKTPTIKLTDNKQFIIFDILKGNYKRASIQHWQEAALLLGLYESYKISKDNKIKISIDTYINSKIDATGSWKVTPKEIDGVILAYALLTIDWVDHSKIKPALDAIWLLVQDLVGEDGTAQYRKSMKNYRYVDTIGFICPFLTCYGVKFQNDDAIKLAVKQITEFNKYGMLSGEFLPCHTYQTQTKLGAGLYGWGRGLGWYAIGLIDSWTNLPENHELKSELTKSVVAFAKMAMRFQNDNGSWNWLVTCKETRADSSATATIVWFLANAATIEELKSDCLISKDKAINYLMKVTRRDGAIDFSQGDTKGIGVHSQEFDILPFTQGYALRTITN